MKRSRTAPDGESHEPAAELPPGVTLCARFLDDAAARALQYRCLVELPWRQPCVTLYGRTAPIPRRTAWLAAPGRSYRYSGIREIGTGIPQFMIPLLERVRASVGVAFDSVLATHYRDGADRLGWHADDEAELGPEPALAIVSLGAPRMLRFRRRRGRVAGTGSLGVTLTAGSLLYMAPGVQRDWEHCVPARAQAGRRISLGLRRLHTADVPESTAAEAGAGNA